MCPSELYPREKETGRKRRSVYRQKYVSTETTSVESTLLVLDARDFHGWAATRSSKTPFRCVKVMTQSLKASLRVRPLKEVDFFTKISTAIGSHEVIPRFFYENAYCPSELRNDSLQEYHVPARTSFLQLWVQRKAQI